MGDPAAIDAYREALACATNEAERRFLAQRLAEVERGIMLRGPGWSDAVAVDAEEANARGSDEEPLGGLGAERFHSMD